MKLHEYLQLCRKYIFPNTESQLEFMSAFFYRIMIEDFGGDIEHQPLFSSRKDRDKAKKIMSGARPLPRRDVRYIKSSFDEEGLITLLEELDP